ncbi:peptide chain release factor 1 [Candidatus Woesearchaeota archaeon]|nr:peptide chain release factor 1 [Candidatus Woesearchaeota archaeon]|tara:strand:+ start:2627 stop:3730 length:1104 start_codon:yes stop_codon:yes gene_type:complete
MVSKITAKQQHDLKAFIKELGQHKGRHTELVTIYVPVGYDLNKIIQQLQQEQGTAANIKSASTRKNVIDALERMVQHLRLFKKTPENGLAVFSGNIAPEGKQDFKVWSLEPPIPIQMKLYRCDKTFLLDLLIEMLQVKEVYGLVLIDRREGIIASLKGKSVTVLSKHTSNVPGKMRAGGQSAARFGRIRENAAKEFYIRMGEHLKDAFFENKNLKGIIVGGPGHTKQEFLDGDFITSELRKKVIAIKDITYTDEFGLQELLDSSQDILAKEELASEKKVMNKFFEYLAKNDKMVSYGNDDVIKKLQMGAVDLLLLSESLSDENIAYFEEEAAKYGTKVEIISVETREGIQLKEFGGIGAILRYEIHE